MESRADSAYLTSLSLVYFGWLAIQMSQSHFDVEIVLDPANPLLNFHFLRSCSVLFLIFGFEERVFVLLRRKEKNLNACPLRNLSEIWRRPQLRLLTP
jgi:hypothetical protein